MLGQGAELRRCREAEGEAGQVLVVDIREMRGRIIGTGV
jgi:hypothetical protein